MSWTFSFIVVYMVWILGSHLSDMAINILKLIFFHIPWIHYKLDGNITKIYKKIQFNVILSCFKQILNKYMSKYIYLHTTTCTIFWDM